jgi:hypothetical protein
MFTEILVVRKAGTWFPIFQINPRQAVNLTIDVSFVRAYIEMYARIAQPTFAQSSCY